MSTSTKHEEETCDDCGGAHTDISDLKDKITAAICEVLAQSGIASSPHNKRAVSLLVSEVALSFAFEAGQQMPEEETAEGAKAPAGVVIQELDLASAPEFIQEMMRNLNGKLPKA
jgi:hypothetical protein